MLRLEIHQRDKTPWIFESEKSPLFVGRDPSMDIVLDDLLVSRQHAVISEKGGQHIVQDVGGRNPLRVNRRVVVRHVLQEGDVIVLGGTQMRYHVEAAVAVEAGAAGGTGEDLAAVVDARQTLESFREKHGDMLSSDATVASRLFETHDDSSPRRNLRILRNFSELIRNLSERQKLLESALHAVFDSLEAKCGFIGFFSPGGDLEIFVERMHGGSGDRISYSPSVVERVRSEALGILFRDVGGGAEDGSANEAPASTGWAAKRRRTIGEKSGHAELGADGASAALGADGASAALDARSVQQLRIQSAMCLPLFRGDRVCGILYVDNRGRSSRFSQEDLYFANVLSNLISLAVEKEDLYEKIHEENIELRTMLNKKNRLIGASSALKEVQRKVKRVSAFDTTVLIIGESGTGKELVARAIHDRSPRRGKPFIAVNCAAIPEPLLESELFGYAPHSGISGSDPKGKPGKFELADKGTLFLDEIGDMSLSTQAKILRVLEDRVVDRLGGMEGTRVDLRILAATNKLLGKAVEEGQFREDLYYRLKVFQIDLPPLRDRREDILPLALHFLTMHEREGRGPIELSPRAKELLLAYRWPGNIRELKHCIEEAVLLSNGRTVYPENLPGDLRRDDNPEPFGKLSDIESQHIQRVLQSVNWNKRRAAEMLGINRSTLYEKIRLYSIKRPPEPEQPVREAAARSRGGAGFN